MIESTPSEEASMPLAICRHCDNLFLTDPQATGEVCCELLLAPPGARVAGRAAGHDPAATVEAPPAASAPSAVGPH